MTDHVRLLANAFWLFAGAVLALLVLAIGCGDLLTDAGQAAALPSIFPTSVRSASQRAEEMARRGQYVEAEEMARRVLHTSAQDSQALRTLATVSSERGNPAAADTAIVIAAHLGWRDSIAQQRIFRRAAEADDVVAAAQAGDALLRTGFDQKSVFSQFDTMIATAGGRAALEDILQVTPPWASLYFRRYATRSRSDSLNFGALLAELNERGARPDDVDVQHFFTTVIERGEILDALAVWRRVNSNALGDPQRGLVDRTFADFASGTSPWGPFGWRLVHSTSTDIDTIADPRALDLPRLAVTVTGDSSEPSLMQLIALPPGTYDFSYDARLDRGRRSTYQWAVTCLSKQTLALKPAFVSEAPNQSRHVIRFVVPRVNCNGQTVALITGPAPKGGAYAEFSGLSLTSASRRPAF